MHDPVAAPAEAKHEYDIELVSWEQLPVADAVVVAVAHRGLLNKNAVDYRKKIVPNGCFVDVKSQFDAGALRAAGLSVWRL